MHTQKNRQVLTIKELIYAVLELAYESRFKNEEQEVFYVSKQTGSNSDTGKSAGR